MQRIPVHVVIAENEMVDALAKESRQLNIDTSKVTCITVRDINSVVKSKLNNRTVRIKHQIHEISENRTLSTTYTYIYCLLLPLKVLCLLL